MTRSEYQTACKYASIVLGKDEWREIKWPDDALVSYRGELYVPVSYDLHFHCGEPIQTAVLRSVEPNYSLVRGRMSEVKANKGESK